MGKIIRESREAKTPTAEMSEQDQGSIVSFSIGVALCALSATFSVIGMNLQKLAHQRNENLPEAQRVSYVRSYTWWIGMSGVIFGAVLDFVSLAFAPQTVVAAFGSSTLVINSWTAPFILKEELGREELGATFLITCGATIVVINASHTTSDETLSQLIERFKTSAFVVYICTVLLIAACLGATYRECEKRQGKKAAGTRYSKRLHAVSITALSGIIGAQSLLFAKAFMLILKQTFIGKERSPFLSWETYIIILVTIACVLSQTHALNTSLARFDAVLVLPIFQVFWIISGVVGAGVFYSEFNAMRTAQMVMLVLGFAIIAYGIYMLGLLHISFKRRRVLETPVEVSRIPTAERFTGMIMGFRGLPILDDRWYQVYEETRTERAHSADLGYIQRQLYGSSITYDAFQRPGQTPGPPIRPPQKPAPNPGAVRFSESHASSLPAPSFLAKLTDPTANRTFGVPKPPSSSTPSSSSVSSTLQLAHTKASTVSSSITAPLIANEVPTATSDEDQSPGGGSHQAANSYQQIPAPEPSPSRVVPDAENQPPFSLFAPNSSSSSASGFE
eukprot:c9095_g1_i1.p1 GENE.c9095_g1_i1~~c9095_g1_i1.p1  ORF type:complete len:562 (+),score=114.30 c9095_g1_i1:1-1686(+)